MAQMEAQMIEKVNESQLQVLKHALGLDWSKFPYRNHFAARVGHADWVLESRQHDSERWSAYRLQRTRFGWQGEAVNKVDVFPLIMLKNKGFRLIFKHDL